MAFIRRVPTTVRLNICSVRHIFQTGRLDNSENINDTIQSDQQLHINKTTESGSESGFGKAFKKFSKITDNSDTAASEPEKSFAAMLRHSKLTQV